MKYINLTPHAIVLNDGTKYEPSGEVARVSEVWTLEDDGLYTATPSEITSLPSPQEDVAYIVSAMVFSATDREDVYAPATGHPDTVRNDKGHIISVPGLRKH